MLVKKMWKEVRDREFLEVFPQQSYSANAEKHSKLSLEQVFLFNLRFRYLE
jgi:hypothetical protein